jgi:hypothetical protein
MNAFYIPDRGGDSTIESFVVHLPSIETIGLPFTKCTCRQSPHKNNIDIALEDKNQTSLSFPYLSFCPVLDSPKSTTKDSHTRMPRSCSHNGPTNPRNKCQTNPTWKHNSKSKGLRQSGKHLANYLQCLGGLSARRARTVQNCYLNIQ